MRCTLSNANLWVTQVGPLFNTWFFFFSFLVLGLFSLSSHILRVVDSVYLSCFLFLFHVLFISVFPRSQLSIVFLVIMYTLSLSLSQIYTHPHGLTSLGKLVRETSLPKLSYPNSELQSHTPSLVMDIKFQFFNAFPFYTKLNWNFFSKKKKVELKFLFHRWIYWDITRQLEVKFSNILIAGSKTNIN